MLKALLSVRLKQLLRSCNGLAWYHYIVLATSFVFLIIWLIGLLQPDKNPLPVLGVALAAVLLLHLYRTDKRFIALLHAIPARVFWLEYSLLLLPLFLLLLFSESWYLVFPAILVLLAISYLNIKLPKAAKASAYTFIPAACYEWKSGFRRNSRLLLLLYLAAFPLCIYPVAPLLLLWLVTAMICSFYQECEPANLLLLPKKGPKEFLRYKLQINLRQYGFFSLPLLLVYCVLHPGHTWLAVPFYLLLLLVLATSILAKYAHYEPNLALSSAAAFLTSINQLSPLLPFLLPFPLVSAVRNYRLAIKRLNFYLDDFDN